MACYNGHLNVIKYLLEIKLNINISVHNDICFYYACEQGHIDIIKYLI